MGGLKASTSTSADAEAPWTLRRLGLEVLGDAWNDADRWRARPAGGLLAAEWRLVRRALGRGASAELVDELCELVEIAALLPSIRSGASPSALSAPAALAEARDGLAAAGLLPRRITATRTRPERQLALFAAPDALAPAKLCRVCNGLRRAVAVNGGGKLATRRQARSWRWRDDEIRLEVVECWRCGQLDAARWWWPHVGGHGAFDEPRGPWRPWLPEEGER